MPRQKLTLRLNAEVIKKAKNLGLNLSGFLEIRLQDYFALIESGQNHCENNRTPRGRFELPRGRASRALQARAVPGWATSAKTTIGNNSSL
jgi:hypothetical protein